MEKISSVTTKAQSFPAHEFMDNGPKRVSRIIRILKRVEPLLNQYKSISQCVLTAGVSAHRGSSKLLSTLLRLFAELAEKVVINS